MKEYDSKLKIFGSIILLVMLIYVESNTVGASKQSYPLISSIAQDQQKNINEIKLVAGSQTTPVNNFKKKVDDPDDKYLLFGDDEEHDHSNDHHGCDINQSGNTTTANKKNSVIFKNELAYYNKLSHKMRIIISPILLIIGGIGNPLCIIILLRKRKPNSTIIYLCLLALIDVLVLYTGLLRQYLKEILEIDLRDISSFTCKLHIFLTYTVMQISSYILVSVTVNRLAITYNRTMCCRTKNLPNPSNSRQSSESNMSVYIIFGIICLAVSAWNVHFLIYYDLTKQNKESPFIDDCTIDKLLHFNYYNFRVKYYSQIHLYLFIAVPCFILFVSNILIIKKIMQLSNPRLRTNSSINGRNDESHRKKERKKTRLSIMLVAVCLWFMILKTPASVYITFPVAEMNKSRFPFTYTLFMLINYTNHAVNLILYILTSASFRRDFKEVFCLIAGRTRRRDPQENEIDATRFNHETKKLNNIAAADGDDE